jgi:beta-lactamase regulating signal transducer with metallopeptidase domain
MKNKSSNDAMEQVFKQLADIQKVEPNTGLYASIIDRIEKPQMISVVWLRVAAAVLLIFFSFELILLKKDMEKAESNQLETLVPETQNILYND